MAKNQYIQPTMSESTELFEHRYKQVYEEEIRGLERRCAHDPSCDAAELRGVLKALYVREGNDIEGRGQLQDAALSATIAAYEHFIAELNAREEAQRTS